MSRESENALEKYVLFRYPVNVYHVGIGPEQVNYYIKFFLGGLHAILFNDMPPRGVIHAGIGALWVNSVSLIQEFDKR